MVYIWYEAKIVLLACGVYGLPKRVLTLIWGLASCLLVVIDYIWDHFPLLLNHGNNWTVGLDWCISIWIERILALRPTVLSPLPVFHEPWAAENYIYTVDFKFPKVFILTWLRMWRGDFRWPSSCSGHTIAGVPNTHVHNAHLQGVSYLNRLYILCSCRLSINLNVIQNMWHNVRRSFVYFTGEHAGMSSSNYYNFLIVTIILVHQHLV